MTKKIILILVFLCLCTESFGQEFIEDFKQEGSASVLNEELRKLRKRVLVATGTASSIRDANLIFMPIGMGQNGGVPDRSADNLYMLFDPTSEETSEIPSIIVPRNFDSTQPVYFQISWMNGDSGLDTIVWKLKNSFALKNEDFGSYSTGDEVNDTSFGASNINVTDETTIT